MKKHITLLTAGTMIAAMMAGCVIPGGNTVLQACTYDTAPAYAPSHAVTRHTFSDTDTGSGWFSGTYSYDPLPGSRQPAGTGHALIVYGMTQVTIRTTATITPRSGANRI